jgi:hypothetical protein
MRYKIFLIDPMSRVSIVPLKGDYETEVDAWNAVSDINDKGIYTVLKVEVKE